VILDYVASSGTLSAAFDALAPDGRVVIQGVAPPGDELRLEPRAFIHRQVSIGGSRYASRREVAETMELVRRGTLRAVVTMTTHLESAESLFAAIAERRLLGRAALVIAQDAV
jgi:D-arabinose 1-dehydrogenase-like Zn-dependent alcohol dehydrogenase